MPGFWRQDGRAQREHERQRWVGCPPWQPSLHPHRPLCIERRPRSHKAAMAAGSATAGQGTVPGGECDLEQQAFLGPRLLGLFARLPDPYGSRHRPIVASKGCCNSANLKAVASMTTALIVFPGLICSAYVFLPSRACHGEHECPTGPFEELTREVEIHRHFVSQSVDLFILYFFNIAVLSTYLPQEGLKVIPLLTALLPSHGFCTGWRCHGPLVRGFDSA
ncbi:hypothetical protein E2320_022500 [Naja naja]|nr:hypothetical protein E2320_022500 [Naja naja]